MGFPALVEIHLDAVVADKRLAHFRVGPRFTPNPAVGSLLAFKLTGNALVADVTNGRRGAVFGNIAIMKLISMGRKHG